MFKQLNNKKVTAIIVLGILGALTGCGNSAGHDIPEASTSSGMEYSVEATVTPGNGSVGESEAMPSSVTTVETETPQASSEVSAPESTQEPSAESDKSTEASDEIRPEFKDAMDQYESFMNEYCDFMKKYASSDGTDLNLLTDYANCMSKYAEVQKAFDAWDGQTMNSAETNYYIEVQTRVSQKLLTVAAQ